MAILLAKQDGSFVRVYDEKNRSIFSKSGELHGYTSHTVTIKRSGFLYTFDEKGRQIASHSA